MSYLNSSSSYLDWGWILWLGFIFLIFSSVGNWGYAHRAHRKVDGASPRNAAMILNERFASGELTRTQYLEMKSDIAP